MLLDNKEQVHFWRELERAEQWLSTNAGAAAGRVYDTMGRPGERTFVSYSNQVLAGVARVERVRQALEQSGPMAKRLVVEQLSGIDLSDVWEILIAACKEIALYYGGSVVAGAVVGGAVGSLALGVGAVPGAIAGTAAGSQVGIWVLTLLGLKELAVGLCAMFPDAMEHYQRGFLEAWGAVPDNRRDIGNSAALPTGNVSAAAWHMAQGHVLMVTAILTALVAYLTVGRGNIAVLVQKLRQSRALGERFARWVSANEGRLLAHPQLQARPNNSVPMAMGEPVPGGGRGASSNTKSSNVEVVEVINGPQMIAARDAVNLGEFKRLNMIDPAVGRIRPGEAGAAAELQNYMKGNLERALPGTPGDFIFTSGPNAGKTVDFMLTPDSMAQAGKINNFFAKNTARFSEQLGLHLNKADIVPLDMRFLTPHNQGLLMDIISKQPPELQSKIIILR
ncbi:hypothetical protein OU994_25210 [Pseudoduganella sp. SL102]|uniref:DUF6861 domain-containing protein n=1 Tax=Pseudoduganella sp. SL102 TaxID=2995154 RepID=UPI00248C6680|nr:hypothetical protein [Pseudoduganella sp. SL102]WBS01542.1 hypothetical protein OU994_25210 [Pseudoduganella sp. SL102]